MCPYEGPVLKYREGGYKTVGRGQWPSQALPQQKGVGGRIILRHAEEEGRHVFGRF